VFVIKTLIEGVQMRLRTIVIVSAVAVLVTLVSSGTAPAVAQTASVRTAWDAPDLRGIWDFRTITPLERPDALAEQTFLTAEEAATLEQEVVDRNARLLARAPERTKVAEQVDTREDGTPGFYNNFWLDQGTTTVGTRRTSLIIDPPNGRIPALTPTGQNRAAASQTYRQEHPADSWLDRSASDRCLLGFNAGPPLNPVGYNQNLQIFQTPDHVVLVTEMVHTARVVPLDGRPPLDGAIRQWSGDARGHWEGDTLIVETSNFNSGRRWRSVAAGAETDPEGLDSVVGVYDSTKSLTLVERFTRVDAATLEYEYTVTDPETWTRPWTASIPLQRTDVPMYEYACHEGNLSMYGILGGRRADEKAAASRP
jgi:hypothetical protein